MIGRKSKRSRPAVSTSLVAAAQQQIKQKQKVVIHHADVDADVDVAACQDRKSATIFKKKKSAVKQEVFVREYLVDFNATQAAIRAGYSKHRATQKGYDILKKPHVQQKINELKEKTAYRLEITVEKVLQERAEIAFAQTNQLSGGLKITASDKNKALDALDKYLGLYERDNVQKGEVSQEAKNAVISELLRNIAAKQTTLPSQQPKPKMLLTG